MKPLMTILYISTVLFVSAQKPSVDTSTFGKWPTVDIVSPIVTKDGKFIAYTVQNMPAGHRTMVLQATDNNWKKELMDISAIVFTEDCHWSVLMQHDTLCLLRLSNKKSIYLTHVQSFTIVKNGEKQSLIYSLSDSSHTVIIRDFDSGIEKSSQNVKNYFLNEDNTIVIWEELNQKKEYILYQVLLKDKTKKKLFVSHFQISNLLISPQANSVVFQTKDELSEKNKLSLLWIDLKKGLAKQIFQSVTQCSNIHFDNSGQQLIFVSDSTIWYYNNNTYKTEIKINAHPTNIESNLVLEPEGRLSFDNAGHNIYFSVIEQKHEIAHHSSPSPIIWSYCDEYLRYKNSELVQNYLCKFNIYTNVAFRIEKDGETNTINPPYKNKYMLINKAPGLEWWWRPKQRGIINLVCLADGSRSKFNKSVLYNGSPLYELSPDERFVIFYDPSLQNYCSFEIETQMTRNITKDINSSWEYKHYNEVPDKILGIMHRPIGIAGWINRSKYILIYSQYDIWKIDPLGISMPVNLTGNYGSQHHIEFTISNWISDSSEFILQGINEWTKEVGIYKQTSNTKRVPKLLMKGNYSNRSKLSIMPAGNSNGWIIGRNTPTDAPNLFYTKNWKIVHRISDVQPQKLYSWYTTELITYILPNGDTCQGTLFKPENIDTTKKYPVIFSYYEYKSIGTNNYYLPEWMPSAGPNIPYLVGQGYLIFEPDIHMKIGHPGQSALESVESAAKYLSKIQYVNKLKLGLMGHSYGGFETNYIVANSNLFAAAIEGAGNSDLISRYNEIDFDGNPYQNLAEISQNRIGVNLWENPNLYIENSPVFNTDKVTTPILIIHNKQDNSVPWQQGIEWFLSLRRLEKKAWLLQYENEGHFLRNTDNIRDLTKKMLEFFDYFLKDASPPLWLSERFSSR